MQFSNHDYFLSCRMTKNLKKLFRSRRTKFWIQLNQPLINVDIDFFYPIFFVATPYVDISISDKIMLSDVSNEIIYLFQIDTLGSFKYAISFWQQIFKPWLYPALLLYLEYGKVVPQLWYQVLNPMRPALCKFRYRFCRLFLILDNIAINRIQRIRKNRFLGGIDIH